MDGQEWVRVVPKRAIDPKKAAKYRLAGSLQRRDSTVTNHEKSHDDNLTVEDIIKGFSPLLASLTRSDFLKRVLMSLQKTAPEGFSMMISLGVGNVLSSQSSLLQFALVLCIRESWQLSVVDAPLAHVDHDVSKITMQDGDISNDLKYQIFDPLFSAKESLVCSSLGLFVSDENRKGKHKAAKGPTLFFMPHCPYRLYVNLLWENWDNLENVIILGNSFQSYGLRRPYEDDKTDCIALLRPLITEIPIWDDYCKGLKGKKLDQCLPPELAYLENAFCDLSIHYFSAESLSSSEASKILACRPGEAEIDEAAALDVELFS